MTHTAESLTKQLSNANDHDKVKLLLELGRVLSDDEPVKARQVGEKVIVMAQRLNMLREIAEAHILLGDVFRNQAQYDTARDNLQRAIEIYDSQDDKYAQARVCNTMADLHLSRNKYEEAQACLRQGQELARELESLELELAYHKLSSQLYESTSDFEKALEHYKKFADLQSTWIQQKKDQSISTLSDKIAQLTQQLSQLQKADAITQDSEETNSFFWLDDDSGKTQYKPAAVKPDDNGSSKARQLLQDLSVQSVSTYHKKTETRDELFKILFFDPNACLPDMASHFANSSQTLGQDAAILLVSSLKEVRSKLNEINISVLVLVIDQKNTKGALALVQDMRSQGNATTRLIICPQDDVKMSHNEIMRKYEVDAVQAIVDIDNDRLATTIFGCLHSYRAVRMANDRAHSLEAELAEKAEEFEANTRSMKKEISARRLMEKSLRKLKNAIEAVEVGVTITDPDGIIIYTNPADAKMHGYRVRELIGQHAKIFGVHPDKLKNEPPPQPKKSDQKVDLERFKNWAREGINYRKDGSTFPVRLISKHIKDAEDELIGLVTVCEDISERKKSDGYLQEARQDVGRLTDERKRLIEIINQQLRDPIAVVTQTADMFNQVYPICFSHDQISKLFSIIGEMSQRTLNIIKNLQEVHQLEAGEQKLNSKRFDLRFLVENVVSEFSTSAEQKKVQLKYDFPEIECPVIADMHMTQNVVRNLISNAVKFSSTGKNVWIELQPNDKVVRFQVKDEGQGLSAEDQKIVFNKFAQLSARPIGDETSTGLDLPIIKLQIELMQGKIWAESEGKDKGSRFIVELPLGNV